MFQLLAYMVVIWIMLHMLLYPIKKLWHAMKRLMNVNYDR
jgi:hypothetical protein